MRNIKQAQRLIRLKLELDQTLDKLSKEQGEKKQELNDAFNEFNESFHLKNFKKKLNQILIGLLADKGLKPNQDYRINNHRLYLHSDDTLYYKGYGQKLERELDVYNDSLSRMLGSDFVEPEFFALLEKGKALKLKIREEFEKKVEDRLLLESKLTETYIVPAWSTGKTELLHVQKIYIKLRLSKYNKDINFEIKNINNAIGSNYTNDDNYSRNNYLFLYPSYRNTANKLIQQATNTINKLKQKVIEEENKLTKNISTKYATYLLLRGMKK